jgi:FdrA protein
VATGYLIRKNQYYDSVFLMRVSKTLSEEPGVRECAVFMATDANKEFLAGIGIQAPEVIAATANDLVVGIRADDALLVERLLGEMDARLRSRLEHGEAFTYRSIEAACSAAPQSNLVVISVPGAYAAREARKALEQGKHLFVFSSNVPLEQEVELKQMARSRHLLAMGPDCGTSLIGGVGIGFANRVRRGPVGVVGASGTGIQEFTSLVHQAGGGISHAIGTGTHDLSDAVGGITTLVGLDVLEADPATELITLISKPAGTTTLRLLQERIQRCRKPVIGCLLGLKSSLDCGPHFAQVRTIDQAVEHALSHVSVRGPGEIFRARPIPMAQVEQEVGGWLPEQRYLRGLFAGGTFCFQAQQVLQDAGIPVYSNTPLDSRYWLKNPQESLEHSIIDLGDDYFTQGKPHPMIDAGERRKRILQEANDPEVAILLLDFVLGEMASPDPVGDLIGAIRQFQESVACRGGHLSVVASVCGTDQDRQGLDRQERMLSEAGVFVLPSSAKAAEFCRDLIQRAGRRQDG